MKKLFTKKNIIRVFTVALFISSTMISAADFKPITTLRGWGYLNATVKLSPHWAFTAMPGYRYEFSREQDGKSLDEKKNFYNELFLGPVYSTMLGKVRFSMPIWYYYMAFPDAEKPEDYTDAHNLAIVPVFAYKMDRFIFVSRTILHNTFYASVQKEALNEKAEGYGLLWRQMLLVNYAVTKKVIVYGGDEIWVGAIENKDVTPHPTGYFPSGLARNRVIGGMKFIINKEFSIAPEYIYETWYGVYDDLIPSLEKNKVWMKNHYIKLTVNYSFDASSPAKKPEIKEQEETTMEDVADQSDEMIQEESAE